MRPGTGSTAKIGNPRRRCCPQARTTRRDDILRDLAALRLAKVQRQIGKLDEALEILAGVLSPGFAAEVAELTGDILVQKGDNADAREAYQSALELAPDAGRVLLELKLATVAPAAPGDETESPGQ